MPVQGNLKACGPADAEGEIRERVQTNGRCEASNDRGDTYGPVAYLAYVPGYALFGWTGKWDDLPAAHFTRSRSTSSACSASRSSGWRFGGARLAATLAVRVGRVPLHAVRLELEHERRDPPRAADLRVLLRGAAGARGGFAALAGWTKFAALVVAPLWATYPEWNTRRVVRYVVGYLVGSALAFSVLLLEPNVLDAARTFWDRTLGWQLGRESPFSIWDWGRYHARGIPDLHLLASVSRGCSLAGALAAAFVPRRKSPLQLAALTAALIVGFELVLTHWFYLYLPWFFPFAHLRAARP